jgi:hypothetical protein
MLPRQRTGSSPWPGEVAGTARGTAIGAIVVAGALMVFDGSYGLITGK